MDADEVDIVAGAEGANECGAHTTRDVGEEREGGEHGLEAGLGDLVVGPVRSGWVVREGFGDLARGCVGGDGLGVHGEEGVADGGTSGKFIGFAELVEVPTRSGVQAVLGNLVPRKREGCGDGLKRGNKIRRMRIRESRKICLPCRLRGE